MKIMSTKQFGQFTGPYDYKPAPRANPRGELMGAWVVTKAGVVVKRFGFDGRDKCEEWIRARLAPGGRRAGGRKPNGWRGGRVLPYRPI